MSHSYLPHKRSLRSSTVLAALACAAVTPPAAADSTSALVSCRPVAVKSTYGGAIPPNAHLSAIRHGKVRTLHARTGATKLVRFRHGSGRWLVSTSGTRFAVAGQALTLAGRPGGMYVIAAKLGTGRSVACSGISNLRARVSDSAGVMSGTSLPGQGYEETMGSSTNVDGRLLANEPPLEVCANHPTHPDGAEFTRRLADGVWCFKGRGAYLNDPNGVERDIYGNVAHEYAHWVVYNNSVVAGAKRPAVRPDGKASFNSAIVWRPVSQNVVTTNGFGF